MNSACEFIDVPVFEPNKNEFKNFRKLIEKIESNPAVINAGLAKIVPPVKYSPKIMSGDFVVKRCLVQKVLKWPNGFFMVDFKEEKKMFLKDFERLAQAQSSSTPNEDEFWDSLMMRNKDPPMYTVENEESMYPTDFPYWRIDNLQSKDSIIHGTGEEVKGINTSYVYIGMQYSTFPAHIEDSGLASMNLLHSGMPKMWYGVGCAYGQRLEQLVKMHTPENIDCDLIIRHKSVLIPPIFLAANNIEFSKVEQHPGEIIVAVYNAYHQGFNFGLNYAEATNYATPNWSTHYNNVQNCTCKPYGTIARDRHLLLGKFIENWQLTTTQPESFNEENHWLKFDDKKSRSRCKLDDCDGFTHAFCTKCDMHFCFTPTQRRNCFQSHLESVGSPNEHWPEFDSKSSRSRCKLCGCDGFTFIHCAKCNLHLCCSINRNCFMKHHE